MQSFVKQLTSEQAKQIYASRVWETWSIEKTAKFQLYQDCLCVPWSVFQNAVSDVLDRPVYTHEFANPDNLRREMEGILGKPTMQEIIDMLPKDKVILIGDEQVN